MGSRRNNKMSLTTIKLKRIRRSSNCTLVSLSLGWDLGGTRKDMTAGGRTGERGHYKESMPATLPLPSFLWLLKTFVLKEPKHSEPLTFTQQGNEVLSNLILMKKFQDSGFACRVMHY